MTHADISAPHVLFFSRGRGRGHAVPDAAIVEELLRLRPLWRVTFASYSTGAETLTQLGKHVIDLALHEDNPFVETLCRCVDVVRRVNPSVIISHEEFAALPAAKLSGLRGAFLVDWFLPRQVLLNQCMECADRIVFLDEPAVYDEPPNMAGRICYAGTVLRPLPDPDRNRSEIRQRLNLPTDAKILCVLPGGSSFSMEQQSPIAQIVLGAFEMLPTRNKLLLWVPHKQDVATLRNISTTRSDIVVREPHPDILETISASDVVITKGTRSTTFEANALGIPSVSISHGLNPVDDYRIPFVRTNTHLRASGLTASYLCECLEVALTPRVPLGRRSDTSPQCLGRVRAASLLVDFVERS